MRNYVITQMQEVNYEWPLITLRILWDTMRLFFRFLSENRSSLKPKYFGETIRRHIWGMNEEGSNNDWSVPEIIGGIIAGNLSLFGELTTIMINCCYR